MRNIMTIREEREDNHRLPTGCIEGTTKERPNLEWKSKFHLSLTKDTALNMIKGSM